MAVDSPRKPDFQEDSFFADERADVPQAQELDGDDAWAEFERLYTQEVAQTAVQDRQHPGAADAAAPVEPAFAPTMPMFSPESPRPVAAPVDRRALPLSSHDVMAEARRFNRVCPRPEAWLRLYELIPGKITSGPQWQPSPPVPAQAWRATSDMPKRMCLRDQVEWAEHHGALDVVMQFLQSLPEEQWHHVGD
jgi:hypothetical protein